MGRLWRDTDFINQRCCSHSSWATEETIPRAVQLILEKVPTFVPVELAQLAWEILHNLAGLYCKSGPYWEIWGIGLRFWGLWFIFNLCLYRTRPALGNRQWPFLVSFGRAIPVNRRSVPVEGADGVEEGFEVGVEV